MAMLVEPSRSVPACPLSTADAPALPCGFPVGAWPNSVYGSGGHGPGFHGADAQGLDARGSSGHGSSGRGSSERGAGERGVGSQGAGMRQVKSRHGVDQTAEGASALDTGPLRAAVMAACSKRPIDSVFVAWLREVVCNLDNPTD